MKCRHCKAELSLSLIDLGSAPLSNGYLTQQTLHGPEKWYPLRVLVCESCWLVQTEDFAGREEIFNADYAYFSGFSTSWLSHCERYVAEMVKRFGLDAQSQVVEVAANDGCLLRYVKALGIPCMGIEPAAGTAEACRARDILVVEAFFGSQLARELAVQDKHADLMVANNVLAHVPDINDFIKGFAILLKPHGVATFEFPHLMQLIKQNQFDTIYHEHFSYLSFSTVCDVFKTNGLAVFDVGELATHGGSLRVFAQRTDAGHQPVSATVADLLGREAAAGMRQSIYYQGFQEKANRVKDDLLAFLLEAKRQGKTVAAYGAAAKGNTLLNYAGIRPDLVPFVVDRNPNKQGKYMPGSRIPIVDESFVHREKPGFVLILPWNLREEVMTQLAYIQEWGGRFVTAVPKLEMI